MILVVAWRPRGLSGAMLGATLGCFTGSKARLSQYLWGRVHEGLGKEPSATSWNLCLEPPWAISGAPKHDYHDTCGAGGLEKPARRHAGGHLGQLRAPKHDYHDTRGAGGLQEPAWSNVRGHLGLFQRPQTRLS